MGKRSSALFGFLTVAVLLAGSFPAAADTAGRPDDPVADETYYDIEGPPYAEDKSGGEGFAVSPDVAASLAMGGASPLTPVSFPYVNYNWSIATWYSTNDGLRFFGVYYKGEQILYDYRTPWVWVNGITRALNTANLVDGPHLYVNYASSSFWVKARYNLGNPNIDVTVSARFYNSGVFEPWVLVVAASGVYNIGVGQRFDFDLGDAADDNQQYYNGSAWKAPGTETSIPDAWYGGDASGNEWRDFDTDPSGTSNVVDQWVYVRPYHTDSPTWYMLRYVPGQLNAPPGGYMNGQTINTYVPGQPDPWLGYDAVNWYVASYTNVQVAYPGPWITVIV